LLEFPDSAFVLLWSTYYVQAYGFADAKYELKRLKIASELGGFADVRYAVFQMTRTATELNHAAITGQADNLKIMELIEHEVKIEHESTWSLAYICIRHCPKELGLRIRFP